LNFNGFIKLSFNSCFKSSSPAIPANHQVLGLSFLKYFTSISSLSSSSSEAFVNFVSVVEFHL
jgi:hypothetical protein